MQSFEFRNLVHLLEERSHLHPALALYTFLQGNSDAAKVLTVLELAEQAKKIALKLQQIAKPGERVIIIFPPGLELIAAFFGGLYAGVIVIPVYPPNTKELVVKLQHIMHNSGAQVALVTQGTLEQVKKLEESIAASELTFAKMQFILTDDLSTVSSKDWVEPALYSDSLAFLQYTSGSTGKPKGVMVSHRNLLSNLHAIQSRNHTSEHDVGVSWLPPYHDMGLIAGIFQPLYCNFPVKLMSPMTFLKRPGVWLDAMSKFKATITGAPNFAYDLCINKMTDAEKSQLDLSHWQIAVTSAEPIRRATVERFIQDFSPYGFRAEAFFPCYGLAESTLIVTAVERLEGMKIQVIDNEILSQGKVSYCDENHPNARHLVSCGIAAANFEVVIVNPETLIPCADGEVGEIWVHGSSVTQGYWEQAKESERCFKASIPNDKRSFLRTGDLGYMVDKSLYMTGRVKELIIIRGRNYYPHDLENAIHNCHSELRTNCCAIFSLEDKEQELLVVVHEIKNRVSDETAEEIVRIIRSTILKTYGIVADHVILAGHKSVPKTTSGKTQRLLCKQRYQKGQLNVLYVDNRQDEVLCIEDSKESDLSKLFKPILEKSLAEVDKKRKLSELGLSSLKLAELQELLTTLIHEPVPLDYLLTDPALNDVLALAERKKGLHQLLPKEQVDLLQEFERYKDIKVDAPNLDCRAPQKILLTGVTGFLGAYLLQELLEHTSWQITCFMQADSLEHGLERITKNLKHYALWKPGYSERIQVVLGNLEKDKLGLVPGVWEHLAAEMDLIIHSAAMLNFIYPYQKLKSCNVLGTRQLLELAGHKRLKAFHYVSTAGYFLSANLQENAVIHEQLTLTTEDGIYGAYNQTKWLAEQLVLHARQLNIPTVIYRPTLITGSSQTGHWNQADVICRVIKGCYLMKARPILDKALNFVPVDYVAQAIVHFVKETPYQSDIFHLLNSENTDINKLFKQIETMGLDVKPVAYEHWIKRINQFSEANDHLFAPLKPFFTDKEPGHDLSLFELYIRNSKAKFDCRYTQERLAKAGIYCAKVDEPLFAKYIYYLQNCGYFTPFRALPINN